jgi:hypothetical protein
MTPAFHRRTVPAGPSVVFDFRGRSITESIERLQWFATDVIPLVDS